MVRRPWDSSAAPSVKRTRSPGRTPWITPALWTGNSDCVAGRSPGMPPCSIVTVLASRIDRGDAALAVEARAGPGRPRGPEAQGEAERDSPGLDRRATGAGYPSRRHPCPLRSRAG